MFAYNREIRQKSTFSHEKTTSSKGSAELSDSENAEINRSFSNLQVSPRELHRTHNNIEEEIPHPEQNFNRMLTKMGLVNNFLLLFLNFTLNLQ